MTAKRISARISSSDWDVLRSKLFTEDGSENAAALLCGIAESKLASKLLVREILPVPLTAYRDRTSCHLEVAPSFYNGLVDKALREGLHPVIVHSHPFSGHAQYSASDDYGESRLLPVLESLVPGCIAASLLLSRTSVTGRILAGGRFVPLDSLSVVGQRSQIIPFTQELTLRGQMQDLYDRQVLAFGTEGQETLGKLRVAIVGVGGTGSIVAEQLARAGVRDFILIDPDSIERSNVSRLFGSNIKDIGSKKVGIIASHLSRLGAKKANAIPDTAIRQPILMMLRDSDVVFSCVDNDRSRSILNRFAYQYLIPVIDVGIRLDGRIRDIRRAAGRVSVVGHGMVCLRCSQHLNAERIRAESLPEQERRSLEGEGYIMGIDQPAPAVVSLNTTVAGLAVTAALNLFLNLTGGLQPVNQLYDATDGIVFIARQEHEDGCDICDESAGVKALGDKQVVSAYS
jgi:molybdopterin-synthase adenylyltransferase